MGRFLMLKRILLAVIVGLVTAFVIWLVGLILVDVASGSSTVVSIGQVLERFALLAGLIAGLWYYLTGEKLV